MADLQRGTFPFPRPSNLIFELELLIRGAFNADILISLNSDRGA